MSMWKRRKGFAIVLVASLAGLVFLLGASLVVVTRLQTTAANYDQRVRLARDHARAALQVALAELQENLGSDTSVSYTADVLRTNDATDFKDEDAAGVREPFWTAAKNGGDTVWLVTRGWDGSGAEPTDLAPASEVELVGEGTVGSDLDSRLGVTVPKNAIATTGVSGFAAEDKRTVGHYAYWVGDLGVKASYALYDKIDQVQHDEYGSDRRERLRQLTSAKPIFDPSFLDTNLQPESGQTLDNSNPLRIDAFASDFQFRDRYGASDEKEHYLLGLGDTPSKEETFKQAFHDFTPLSKGLLVNTQTGGFKKDLSGPVESASDAFFDEYKNTFKDYADAASLFLSTGPYAESLFEAQVGAFPIVPIITEFNLNYSVYLSPDLRFIRLSYSASVEMWNPFASELDLGSEGIVIRVSELPDLRVDIVGSDGSVLQSRQPLGLNALEDFKIEPSSDGEPIRLRPGQISYYMGPSNKDSTEEELVSEDSVVLHFGLSDPLDRRFLGSTNSLVNIDDPVSKLRLSFVPTVDSTQKIEVQLRMGAEDHVDYVFPAKFTLSELEVNHDDVLSPSFGFSWEVDDEFAKANASYLLANTNLSVAALHDFSADSSASSNLEVPLLDADAVLLGHNPSDLSGPLDLEYDVSLLQLPKQEIKSVAQLSGAYSKELSVNPSIGELESSHNDWFDKFYFSTVPQGSTSWDVGVPLPNTGYMTLHGNEKSDLQDVDSAEHLFAHGMFNVHSTSIDAWISLLKSSPASSIPYWNEYFKALEADGNDVLDTEKYLMFNRPLSGEDVHYSVLDPQGDLAAFRASHKWSVFDFDEMEIEVLAKHIVANIRNRVQGQAGYGTDNSGTFSSMEDFVNSGVLKNAITDAHEELQLEGESAFKNSWALPSTPAEFRQSTILNLIVSTLSNRSDTFIIRAYGDATDPSNPVKVWARAYCEAIVQRTHRELSANNREFEVVAFRWLSPSDI